jgi:dipeptidyl aminopeptidase/acylaminoacyl peptidase
MRGLAVAFALLWSAATWSGEPEELYGALPEGTGVRMSPDGQHLAMIAGTTGQPLLVVWHLDGKAPTVIRTEKEIPQWVAWKGNRKVIAGLYTPVVEDADRPYEATVLAAFDPDGRHLTHIHPDAREDAPYTMLVTNTLVPDDPMDLTGNTSSPVTRMGAGLRRTINPAWGQFGDDLASLMPKDSDHILVASVQHPPPGIVDNVVSRDLPGSLASAAIATSTVGNWGRRVSAREVNAVHWLADANGDARLKVEIEGDQRRIYLRDAGHMLDTAEWRLVQTAKIDKQPLFGPPVFAPANLDLERSWVPLAFDSANPNILHVSVTAPSGRLALDCFDVASGRMVGPRVETPGADVTPLMIDGKLAGYRPGRGPAVYFDAALNDRVETLRKLLPGQDVALVDVSTDGKRVLLTAAADGDAPVYWMYDGRAAKPMLAPALQTYPQLGSEPGAKGRWVEIKARDGLMISALLTRPAGAGKLPFIVLPHDGPASHDSGGFDWLVQYLVHLGYGVLQPEFRGSTGFGLALERAGDREWGWKMQDDVTDATLWLAAQGMSDGACILGRGYGGYSALMGAVREPNLYRCAAALDPLTDLERFVLDRQNRGLYRDINVARIAKPDQQKMKSPTEHGWSAGSMAEVIVTAERLKPLTELEKISPVYRAADIQVPILLAHARQDFVEPVGQTEEMEAVLKRLGAKVEAHYYDDDDQTLRNAADRAGFLTALRDFLHANLKASGT